MIRGNTLQRFPGSRSVLTPSEPAPYFYGSSIDLNFTTNYGYSLGTVTTAGALVTTTRASTAYAQNAAGVYSSFSSNVPRITDLGLLIEESRTNSLRNNSMQGAVAPLTLPTNWSVSGAAGLTTTVVGTGAENGIDYLDLRFVGTSAATFAVVFMDTATAIAATNGQNWSASVFSKLVAGSLLGVTTRYYVRQNNAAGAQLSDLTTIVSFSVGATLARATGTAATNNASIAYVQPLLVVNYGSGVALDFTIRIGWPQLELGATVTSPIRTTSAAVTRSADYIIVNDFATWANQSAGTIYAEANVPAVSGTQALVGMDDGTANERITSRSSAAALAGVLIDGGVTQATMSVGTLAANVTSKTALAYALNDGAYTAGGAAPATDTSMTLPTTDRMELGGLATGTINFLNGFLRRVAYFPSRLPDTTLQGITS